MAAPPQLLVSVRHADEARIAIAAGVDFLDMKEPSRGALGRVDATTLQGVAGLVQELAPALPLSLALGEVTDPPASTGFWLPPCLRFFKLGLAGLRDRSNWIQQWLEIRQEWEGRRQPLSQSDGGSVAAPHQNWIAVAYVDDLLATSPPVQEVVVAAIETGCGGVLFDTFSKTHGSLLDWLPLPRLARLVQQIQAAGLLCAAAGRIGPDDFSILADLHIDVIAVRSAATAHGNRNQAIDAASIARLQAALQAARGSRSRPKITRPRAQPLR